MEIVQIRICIDVVNGRTDCITIVTLFFYKYSKRNLKNHFFYCHSGKAFTIFMSCRRRPLRAISDYFFVSTKYIYFVAVGSWYKSVVIVNKLDIYKVSGSTLSN